VLTGLRGMTAAAFSPNGEQLAVASKDTGSIELWNPARRAPRAPGGGWARAPAQGAPSPISRTAQTAVSWQPHSHHRGSPEASVSGGRILGNNCTISGRMEGARSRWPLAPTVNVS
jgi:WD40 repeat protein